MIIKHHCYKILILALSLSLFSCAITSTSRLKTYDKEPINTLLTNKKIGIMMYSASIPPATPPYGTLGATSGHGALGGALGGLIEAIMRSKDKNTDAQIREEIRLKIYRDSLEIIENELGKSTKFTYVNLGLLEKLSKEEILIKMQGDSYDYELLHGMEARKFIEENDLDYVMQVVVSPSISANNDSILWGTVWRIFDINKNYFTIKTYIVGSNLKEVGIAYTEDPRCFEEYMSLLRKSIEDFFLIIDEKKPKHTELIRTVKREMNERGHR